MTCIRGQGPDLTYFGGVAPISTYIRTGKKEQQQFVEMLTEQRHAAMKKQQQQQLTV
ncbi:unnamed protein product, partial [Gongylonema pulchrum]|uniref:Copine domain-containing protein n=1 Tax=Gongylonema pulchrum TaxID=637853 RepID=A0A183ECH6_9BILA